MNKIYIAIDLKSFYASVECIERHLDPLTANLVVADPSRTEKTICLAVSPALKAYGIPGRARLFEVIRKVKEINAKRFSAAKRKECLPKGRDGKYHFASSSSNSEALAANPALELTYCVAAPRMRLYEEYSTKIYSIYLKYVAPEDIHVYSVDEVFMDATPYLSVYGMTPHDLAISIVQEVLRTTGITATAGIGTNLYLAKIAMDIVAKHVPADKDGVRIAELNEQTYREKLWCHQPLSDFWRVGHGTEKRLHAIGLYTMGDIARLSVESEDLLYQAFGVNAELLIDHAWGWEPTEIAEIKAYVPKANSLSSGQVLMRPYTFKEGRLIVREMTELLVLDLVRKGLVTRQIVLTIGYDKESLIPPAPESRSSKKIYTAAKTGKAYHGGVKSDHYHRIIPVHAHGTGNMDRYTSSTKRIMETVLAVYDRIVDPDLLIRRVYIAAAGLIGREEIPEEEPVQLDMFTDYEALERQKQADAAADDKERRIQEATLQIHEKYGKNALIKGMNLKEGGTTIARNGQIGGHRA